MAYETSDALRTALETRLLNEARARGVSVDRLRRLVVFERILVRLEAAQPGEWVLKGGLALEVRLGGQARTTRDLDLALRAPVGDGEALFTAIVEPLGGDPDEDGFRFVLARPTTLVGDQAGRPAWRFTVEATMAGRQFAIVRVDVVARSEELAATERLQLPGMLAFAGIPPRQVEAVAPVQHFAEKLHALTRRYGDRPNTRVRDLVDLVLLIETGRVEPIEAYRVTSWVFAARATHDVPDEIPYPPAFWSEAYAALVQDLRVQAITISQAMTCLRGFWAAARASHEES
jgi:hypothetical protein